MDKRVCTHVRACSRVLSLSPGIVSLFQRPVAPTPPLRFSFSSPYERELGRSNGLAETPRTRETETDAGKIGSRKLRLRIARGEKRACRPRTIQTITGERDSIRNDYRRFAIEIAREVKQEGNVCFAVSLPLVCSPLWPSTGKTCPESWIWQTYRENSTLRSYQDRFAGSSKSQWRREPRKQKQRHLFGRVAITSPRASIQLRFKGNENSLVLNRGTRVLEISSFDRTR